MRRNNVFSYLINDNIYFTTILFVFNNIYDSNSFSLQHNFIEFRALKFPLPNFVQYL